MTLINKIKTKFQNLIGFEKLDPLNNSNFEESSEKFESKENIILLKNLVENHPKLKEIIWIAIYHCSKTFKFKNEFLSVLNQDLELIVDLLEGNDRNVVVPNFVKSEYQKGNILATFHNHFGGAIIPSSNDFYNSILPKLKYTVITSENLIGIIINCNNQFSSEIFQQLINDFKLFEVYLNFCFSNEEFENIKILENSFNGVEFKKKREFLFDAYVAKNVERFVVEFNSRMEKFNLSYVYIKL